MTDATRIAIFGVVISMLSFVVSAVTMYFTWLRRGRLAMTTPTLVFFGFDEVPTHTAKVFLRTLLYSTSINGKVIEGMYVKLHRGHAEQTFSFWGYSDGVMTPGSGLFVPQAGVVANHHFVLSVHEPAYVFAAGAYRIEVFARLAGKARPYRLKQIDISLTESQVAALGKGAGVLFELMPDTHEYIGHSNARGAVHEKGSIGVAQPTDVQQGESNVG